ncbi:MAG: ROK family transcriptional regulator [Galactobacter sp.]
MQRGTNLGRLGGFNQAVVLEAVRHHPDGISRVELAEVTGLSPQTISNVARRLIEGGWIRESGTVISGPGKPRTILELIPDRYVTLGVHVDPGQVAFTLVDLRGSVLAKKMFRPDEDLGPEATVDLVADQAEALLEASGYEKSSVLGLGVAVPGPIDLERGSALHPPLMDGWGDVDLVDPLAQKLGLEVILSKDTVATASAEQWLGTGVGARDFICVYVGVGVGVGLVLGGQIMQGQTGNTGELGHLSTGECRDRECAVCGRNDCLAVNLNYETIVARGKAAGLDLPDVSESSVPEKLAAAERVFELGRAGDPAARTIALELAELVARAVGNVASLVDVDQVVVCGPVWEAVKDFAEGPVAEIVAGSFHGSLARPVTVRTSELGPGVCAVGAACVVLDELVSPKTSGLLLL